MNSPGKTFVFFLGLAGFLISAPVRPAPDPEPSLVKIHVAYQEPDYSRPWNRKREESRSGYGCLVAPGKILTTADIVKDATTLKLEKRGEKSYFPGRIAVVDYDVNLALIAVDDDSFFEDLLPLELEEQVKPDQPVQFLVFEEPDRIRAIPGTIVRVSVERYYLGLNRFLILGAAVNFEDRGGGWSEPVLTGGKLAGMTMTYNGRRQYAGIIPAAIIRRFLDAAGEEGYAGLPHEGFSGSPTRAPALRRFLRLPEEAGGVYVTSVYPRGSAAGVLREGDVVLAVDGRALDAEGYYEDPLWGRLDYRDLFTRFYSPGDRTELEVVRDGEVIRAEMDLRRWLLSDYLVPPYSRGEETEYLIIGGAVFQELTLDYLKEWGSNWPHLTDRKLYYHYYYNARQSGPGRERIVLLNRILPDQVNLGYQGLEDLVLAEVNGRPIEKIADLAEALEHPERGFHRFTFEEYNREIVFRVSDLEEADARISRQYGIPRLSMLK